MKKSIIASIILLLSNIGFGREWSDPDTFTHYEIQHNWLKRTTVITQKTIVGAGIKANGDTMYYEDNAEVSTVRTFMAYVPDSIKLFTHPDSLKKLAEGKEVYAVGESVLKNPWLSFLGVKSVQKTLQLKNGSIMIVTDEVISDWVGWFLQAAFCIVISLFLFATDAPSRWLSAMICMLIMNYFLWHLASRQAVQVFQWEVFILPHALVVLTAVIVILIKRRVKKT